MKVLMEKVIENIRKQNFDELVQIEEFVEFPHVK